MISFMCKMSLCFDSSALVAISLFICCHNSEVLWTSQGTLSIVSDTHLVILLTIAQLVADAEVSEDIK